MQELTAFPLLQRILEILSLYIKILIDENNFLKTDDNEKLIPLPKFATAGSDKTVKIWEFVEGNLCFVISN